MAHTFDDTVDTRQDAVDHHLRRDELSQRQLADRQEPAGGGDQAAVGDRLPAQRAEVLSNEDAESGSARSHVGVEELVCFLDEQSLAVRRLEMEQVVGDLLEPVQRVVLRMGEIQVAFRPP